MLYADALIVTGFNVSSLNNVSILLNNTPYSIHSIRRGKRGYYETEDDSFTDLKTEYPAIVFDDISDVASSREPTIWASIYHTWLIADIEDKYHGPSDTLHNPP
ncbi:hypothetical protein Tco_0007498 [Tanacetum coccineum]